MPRGATSLNAQQPTRFCTRLLAIGREQLLEQISRHIWRSIAFSLNNMKLKDFFDAQHIIFTLDVSSSFSIAPSVCSLCRRLSLQGLPFWSDFELCSAVSSSPDECRGHQTPPRHFRPGLCFRVRKLTCSIQPKNRILQSKQFPVLAACGKSSASGTNNVWYVIRRRQ